MSLAWIPKGILRRMQHICCRFLWRGQNAGINFAWVKSERITKPKKWGGWGLKEPHDFSKALGENMGWKIITTNSLWKEFVYNKYIYPLSIADWIHSPCHYIMGASSIWKAITHSFGIIKESLDWKVGDGLQIRIGSDVRIGNGNTHILPRDMRQDLLEEGFT